MTDQIIRDEEVAFVRDGEDIIYKFEKDRETPDKYTFFCKQRGAQLCQNGAKTTPICLENPNQLRTLEAVIVLYKAQKSGVPLSGFLPGLLQSLVNLFPSREGLDKTMAQSIHVAQYLGSSEEQTQFKRFLHPFASSDEADPLGTTATSTPATSTPATSAPATSTPATGAIDTSTTGGGEKRVSDEDHDSRPPKRLATSPSRRDTDSHDLESGPGQPGTTPSPPASFRQIPWSFSPQLPFSPKRRAPTGTAIRGGTPLNFPRPLPYSKPKVEIISFTPTPPTSGSSLLPTPTTTKGKEVPTTGTGTVNIQHPPSTPSPSPASEKEEEESITVLKSPQNTPPRSSIIIKLRTPLLRPILPEAPKLRDSAPPLGAIASSPSSSTREDSDDAPKPLPETSHEQQLLPQSAHDYKAPKDLPLSALEPAPKMPQGSDPPNSPPNSPEALQQQQREEIQQLIPIPDCTPGGSNEDRALVVKKQQKDLLEDVIQQIIGGAQQELSNLQEDNKNLATDLKQRDERLKQQDASLEQKDERLKQQEANHELLTAEVEGLRGRLDGVRQESQGLRLAAKNAQDQVFRMKREVEERDEKVRNLETQYRKMKAEIRSVTVQRDKLKNVLTRHKVELNELNLDQ